MGHNQLTAREGEENISSGRSVVSICYKRMKYEHVALVE
jgi:hypothetical protein